MRVGFLNNQIDNRGTGNALYDYADYNEKILGNESVIFIADSNNPNPDMKEKLLKRFHGIHGLGLLATGLVPVDFVYHIKYGNDDGIRFSGLPYGVHAVFDGSQPHGDRYATISSWMGEQYNIPHVPHIVKLGDPTLDFRKALGIPSDASVFGRYGGMDSFDIPWVWGAIRAALIIRDDLYFIFMNTERPDHAVIEEFENRVRFIPGSASSDAKASFIHSTDAMLHARARGETFGIACGEFAVAGKPVYTYSGSGEKAHIRYLGSQGFMYSSKLELLNQLLTFQPWPTLSYNLYSMFTPEYVMQQFKAVFLDEGS